MKKITYLLAFLFISAFSSVQAQNCQAEFQYWTSGLTAQFMDSTFSTTGNHTYSWNFGDGGSSTLSNPGHTYNQAGTYSVRLMIQDSLCFDSIVKLVTVTNPNNCVALFSFTSPQYGVYDFQNLSVPLNSLLYSWDFGDGQFDTLSINPSHTYSSSGSYRVMLHAYDPISQCSDTLSQLINVLPQLCQASYTVTKDTTSQFAVTLLNTSSTANSHQYSWDFGDGNFGVGRTPVHQYTNFGSYVVCLKITDSILNCTSTFCDTVGMDSLGNLKSASGFSLTVIDPLAVNLKKNELDKVIAIFPNPAINQVSIDLTSETQISTVRIVDITGSVVFQDNNVYGGAVREINIANFKNGLYFIQIESEGSIQVKKLVKTN